MYVSYRAPSEGKRHKLFTELYFFVAYAPVPDESLGDSRHYTYITELTYLYSRHRGDAYPRHLPVGEGITYLKVL
jgi:hypothetical protein